MALQPPMSSYSDTTPQARMITDVISLIDPVDTPAIELLGGLDGAAGKFRFVNEKETAYEWLEDTLFGLSTLLNGALAGAGTTTAVVDDPIFSEGDIIDVNGGVEQVWVSAVSADGLTLTIVRGYSGSAAAVADNVPLVLVGQARLEGAESTDRFFTDRTTGTNYTQIFHHEVKVTRTQNQIAQYGIDNEMEYQARKVVPSLLRLVERQLFYGVKKAGSATTPRAMGGFPAFVTANSISAGGAVVQADFDDTMELIYADGGGSDIYAFVSPANMQVIKNLYDSSSYLRFGTEQNSIGLKITTVITPFGDVKLVMDRWALNSNIYFINAPDAGLLTFQPFMREPLAKTGDYEREEVVAELGFALRQGDKAHGLITGIT